nr:DVUA0089 family protein [Paracoccus shandongensis]
MAATVQVSRPEQAALLDEGSEGGSSRIATCTPDTPATPLAEGAINERLAQGPVSATQDGTGVGYYRFTLSQAAPVTLRASSPTLDPYLKLFDAQGNLVGENDDADGLNARLDFVSTLAAGDYCIGAATLSSEPGELTISAETLDPQIFLRNAYRKGELNPPSDGSYPVQALDLTQQKQTVVLHDGATQWLGFDLDKPTVLVVSAYGSLAGADPRLVLFAASGALEGENDDIDGSTDARVGPVLLQPGRYHLGVVDVSRNDDTLGPIRPIGLMFDRFLRPD